MVGVVVVEHGQNIQAFFGQNRSCLPVTVAACSIGGAICPVGAEREHSRIRQSGDAGGGRKRQLLIAATQTFSDQMDNRLTTGNIGQRPLCIRVIPGDGGQETARFPGLAT